MSIEYLVMSTFYSIFNIYDKNPGDARIFFVTSKSNDNVSYF